MRCTLLLYCGNFVDLGFYDVQAAVDARHWIFPGELAGGVRRVVALAPRILLPSRKIIA